MDADQTCQISLEIVLGTTPLAGRLSLAGEAACEFEGWTELVATLDGIIACRAEASATNAAPP